MNLRKGRALVEEDLDDELAAWGIDDDEADEWLGDAAGDEEEIETCYVLPPNAPTVHVFLCCQLEIAVGMSGAIYTGIQRSEVLAVCDLLDIPQRERRDVLWGIQVMVNTVLPELNARHG